MSRRRKPLYQQLVDRIPTEYKERFHSYSWSASVHCVALVGLVYCSITVEDRRPLQLQVGFSSAEDDQPLMLENIDTPEPILEEIEAPSELPRIELPAMAEIALPTPTAGLEPAEVITASATEVSSNAESNDSRVIEVTRRVKAAGGDTDGPVRASLMWASSDDIDLHVSYRSTIKPTARLPFVDQGYIWFGQPISSHAKLDVDANARDGVFLVPNPCENVIFKTTPKKATVLVAINLFAWRSRKLIPYVVTIHYGRKSKVFEGVLSPLDGMKQIHQFSYP